MRERETERRDRDRHHSEVQASLLTHLGCFELSFGSGTPEARPLSFMQYRGHILASLSVNCVTFEI